MDLDLTLVEHLIERSRRWCDSWADAWDEDGEPVDDYDAIYALEDDARDIVEALAGFAEIPTKEPT